MKQIEIPKNKLKDLYEKKKLTFKEMAEFYECSASRVWAHLKKYGIKPSRAKSVHISKEDLERLYWKEKLSTREIAGRFGYGKSTVEAKMKKYGIAARSRSKAAKLFPRTEKYKIPKEKLEELYWRQKLSVYKIAKLYNCSPSGIFHKFKKFNIPRRTDVEGIILTNDERCRKIAKAVTNHPRKDFDGSEQEKSYLIGFSSGDLHVVKKKYGMTIYVYCQSTKKEQIILLKKLFNRFGHIWIKKGKKNTKNGIKEDFRFAAYLNLSFDFLLNKEDKIEEWILENNRHFLSFLGGYIDAEGSFGVYNGFGEFALGTYDKNVINQAYNKLKSFGVETTPPRITIKGGYIDKRGVKTSEDLWRLRITRKDELHNFVNLIEPYTRHPKRKRDLLKVKKNVNSRL